MQAKKLPPSCDSCIHHVYNEEYLAYFCEQEIDEDELVRFAFSPHARCPFYQFADEYINVRKQN